MKTYHLKNVIYFPGLNCVGGVETYCYEMGLKYGKDYDITVLCRNGDPNMIRHIEEVCRVIKYRTGDKIICDVFIFGYGWEKELFDNLEAKKIIQTFHADYICRHLNPCQNGRITHRFGVADNTTEGIRKHYEWAKDIQTVYNPYTVKKPHKVLNLISATRLTAEKGLERMKTFANALDEAGVPFHWDIYTDVPREPFNKSVAVMPHRLDILDFIANADYLVQLSDTEGYSYSIVEALSVGTPVICTAFPVAEEQGIVNGVTGFILSFDMKEIPIEAIRKGVKKFKYTPRESHYEEILAPGKSNYKYDENELVEIRVLTNFFDLERNEMSLAHTQYKVTRKRGRHLEELNLVEVLE